MSPSKPQSITCKFCQNSPNGFPIANAAKRCAQLTAQTPFTEYLPTNNKGSIRMIATRTLSITQLFEDHVEKLKLNWVAAVGVERLVELKDMETFGPDVVGHLNLIYCHRV